MSKDEISWLLILRLAAMEDYAEGVELLLDAGFEPSALRNEISAALRHAVIGSDEYTLELLLASGADLPILDNRGEIAYSINY